MLERFGNELGGQNPEKHNERYDIEVKRKGSIAYIIPSQVQYVALCGRLGDEAVKRRGHILVLEHILNCDYLWSAIRVLGGAYGASSDFMYTGAATLSSYRDPHIRETLEGEGMSRLRLDMSGITHDELLRIRRQVIDTSLEDIRGLAPLIEEFIKDADAVVLGGGEMLDKNGALFDITENIL